MNGTVIAVLGVVVVAGVAILAVQRAKAATAEEAVKAYQQGAEAGSRRTDAERIGGAVGTLGQAVYGLFGG